MEYHRTPSAAASLAVSRAHRMPFGASIEEDGQVLFRVYGPGQPAVSVSLAGGRLLPMQSTPDGWHTLRTDAAKPGDRYRLMLSDGQAVADPASRFQPDDYAGPSEIVDPLAYLWADAAWRGRPWHEAVIYEMHVGAFTPQGTFAAAAAKLDELARLGVTAIEIMPIGDFPGSFNWGYDGVLPYAPDSSYGRPDDLKALVDAAHRRGLMVLLDVVYNHFGPEGNFIGKLVPHYVTGRHKTPWGDALNFDGRERAFVREFFIHNALYWIEEYHLDGLRLDAVHAIADESEEHFLVELTRRVRALAGSRHVHLIAENEENEATLLERDPSGVPPAMTAQWNDDLHHVLHTAVTREESGYYHEYLNDTNKLGRALAEGFVFQGQMMTYRGSPRGEPSGHLPPTAFVSFLQNHDQTGNRAFGDRIAALTPAGAVRAAAAIVLLSPQIPMLFMGEEWGSEQPFPFFACFEGELAGLVRDGRRQEFAKFPAFRDPASRDRIPDPTAFATFASAKLQWQQRGEAPHADWLAWTTAILAVRRELITPRLPGIAGWSGKVVPLGHLAIQTCWTLGDGSELILRANLTAEPLVCAVAPAGRLIWSEGLIEPGSFGPWAVGWFLAEDTGFTARD